MDARRRKRDDGALVGATEYTAENLLEQFQFNHDRLDRKEIPCGLISLSATLIWMPVRCVDCDALVRIMVRMVQIKGTTPL